MFVIKDKRTMYYNGRWPVNLAFYIKLCVVLKYMKTIIQMNIDGPFLLTTHSPTILVFIFQIGLHYLQ